MKKLAALLALTLTPTAASAAPGINDILNQNPKNTDINDIVDVLVWVINFGLAFAAAIGALFIVITGYQYIFAAGNPDKLEKAKMGLTWSILGFVLAISSYAIVMLVQLTLGAKQKVNQELSTLPGPSSAATVLEQLLNIIFTFSGAVCILFIVMGGLRYVTSSGNPELIEKGKKTLLYAIIGLIVTIASAALFTFIEKAIT